MQFSLAQDISTLQKHLMVLAAENKRVALVPTMGALHAGHVTLIEVAKQMADAVVVSIFVNPTQFGHNEDFDKYPRMLDADINVAHDAGAALVYAPSVADMYPEGFSTSVSAGELGNILCGTSRPGHFDGVATVVMKLLLRVLPQTAVFGEKDFQQLAVIRRMVIDMDMPINILGVATVRESDGLAMSSRNAYLSHEERAVAPELYKILQGVGNDISSKMIMCEEALQRGKKELNAAGFNVDYLELRNANSLAPVVSYTGQPCRLFAAVWLGKTRLIDNIPLGQV
ncbi:MAG: pantoate--beta-alanine ligase [Alphaproteobacteria bacterium]